MEAKEKVTSTQTHTKPHTHTDLLVLICVLEQQPISPSKMQFCEECVWFFLASLVSSNAATDLCSSRAADGSSEGEAVHNAAPGKASDVHLY